MISKVAQSLLALAALCLLAVLLVPWRGPTADWMSSSPAVSSFVDPVLVQPTPAPVTSAVISSLFISQRAVLRAAASQPSAPRVVGTKKPVEAPWLSYVGYFSRSPGESSYVLKDSRSGRVLLVVQGEISQGWSLVETSDTRLILRHGDDYFMVRKR